MSALSAEPAAARSPLERLWQVSWRCTLAVGLGVLAGLGQRYLRSIGVLSVLLLAYPAVLLAEALGGLFSGVVAVIATTLSLAYLTIEPTGSFLIAARKDAVDLALFFVIGLVLVVLSDRRRRALALATAAQQRAEDASVARESMMAVVAHDLRNPLQAVSLTAELLAPRLAADKHGQELLDRMRLAVQRASALVDSTLERARPGDLLLRVKKSPYALANVVSEIVAQYEPLAMSRSITLRPPAATALEGTLLCDKQRLMQVLGNLLGNALKFTPAGGIVGIDVHRDAAGVHFAVSDSGRGMAADELAHCMDRLWHGTAPGSGSGLGLWIAKTLVDAHGGQIKAESEPGHGTTMSFVLPAT